MNEKITLIDGEEMNRLHPATFEIPPKAERDNIRPGAFVKVGFSEQGINGNERMWVQVQGRRDDGGYFGLLNNDPVVMRSIKCDDRVDFEARHVLGILEG